MPRGPRIDIGTVINDRFEITGFVGGGGMAVVYRGIDREYDRAAAVKVMQAALIRNREFRARFDREARIANHTFHPHILPIFDAGEDRGIFYIATPLADTDLGAYTAEHGTLAVDQALRILTLVAWALDFAHSRGVVHRDVKPENIVLLDNPAGDPHPYLADFGIARSQGTSTLTGDFTPLTAGYAAPEQIEGRRVDGRADQYALACTLYDVVTGEVPFAHSDVQKVLDAHLHAAPPALSRQRPDLPAALDGVLLTALAKDPADRYESCSAFIDACRSASGLSPAAVPAPGHRVARENERANGPVTVAEVEAPTASAPAYDVVLGGARDRTIPDAARAVSTAAALDDLFGLDVPVGEARAVQAAPEHAPQPRFARRRASVLAVAGGGLLLAILALVAVLGAGGGSAPPQPGPRPATLVAFDGVGSPAQDRDARQRLRGLVPDNGCTTAQVVRGSATPIDNTARVSCTWTADPTGVQRTEYWLFRDNLTAAYDDLAADGRLRGEKTIGRPLSYSDVECPYGIDGKADFLVSGRLVGKRACLQTSDGHLEVVWTDADAGILGITRYVPKRSTDPDRVWPQTWQAALADGWRTVHRNDADAAANDRALRRLVSRDDQETCTAVGTDDEALDGAVYSQPSKDSIAGLNCTASGGSVERYFRRYANAVDLRTSYDQLKEAASYGGAPTGVAVRHVDCYRGGDGDHAWWYAGEHGVVRGHYQCLIGSDHRRYLVVTSSDWRTVQVITDDRGSATQKDVAGLTKSFDNNVGFDQP
jgi:serine/threonine-protein kinase